MYIWGPADNNVTSSSWRLVNSQFHFIITMKKYQMKGKLSLNKQTLSVLGGRVTQGIQASPSTSIVTTVSSVI
jgi:hypothetical protein